MYVYCSKTWMLNKKYKNMIEALEMRCWRKMNRNEVKQRSVGFSKRKNNFAKKYKIKMMTYDRR